MTTSGPSIGRVASKAGLITAVLVIALAGLPLEPAHADTVTHFSMRSGPIRAPLHYHLRVHATDQGKLAVSMTKVSRLGNHPVQHHTWDFSFNRALTCTEHLTGCTIDSGPLDGSHTGGRNYGAIDGAFHPTTGRHTHTVTCASTGAVLQKVTTRGGDVTGTPALDFDTNTSDFGRIKRPSFHATVTKVVTTSASCPGGGGGGGDESLCQQNLDVAGYTPTVSSNFWAFEGFRRLPNGRSILTFRYDAADMFTHPAEITHSIEVSVGPNAVRIAQDFSKGTIDGAGGGPMLSGTVTVTRSEPATTAHQCKGKIVSTAAPGTISGNFTAHFDGIGDVQAVGVGSYSKQIAS